MVLVRRWARVSVVLDSTVLPGWLFELSWFVGSTLNMVELLPPIGTLEYCETEFMFRLLITPFGTVYSVCVLDVYSCS